MNESASRADSNTAVASDLADGDPRLAFIYQEAVRGLNHQQNLVENMNARAGSLIFATAFANSLLGGRALSDGLGLWDWIAVVLLFVIGGLIVFLLWPYHKYMFRFDPEELLHQYVDGDRPANMSAMQRALALRIKADMVSNWRIIQRLRVALQIALVLLLFDILAWLFAIAGI
ncbi:MULTISPECIES: hypothetical protein [unclassified Mesorhizobium]|uniref:hypothetical protein n=1 Tax=unclassified Mesorhizobium TaxID=325217 RepID=UPI001CCA8DE0|nr:MULTISPECIES: hypothetical protein [unclassified Mesorhizobium]MBZ9682677.1 hypothetical protein [Mesorhizobium sp. CO1-1-2]MBZ9923903.1 hypothetical protein [Mesorhizobium sp. BR1-1-4]